MLRLVPRKEASLRYPKLFKVVRKEEILFEAKRVMDSSSMGLSVVVGSVNVVEVN